MRRTRERDPIAPDYPELLGDKTGIVGSISVVQLARELPNTYLTRPAPCDVGELIDGSEFDVELNLGGKGETLQDAFVGGIGEALERIPHYAPDEDAMELASYREMDRRGRVIDWEYLDVYNDAVKGDWICELTPETPIYWTTGTDLVTGETVALPADRVWGNASESMDDWSGPPPECWTSNGSAAGPSLEAAILGCIYEIVERDAFVRVWSRQETPPALSLDGAPELRRYRAEEIDRGRFSTHLIGYESPVDIPAVGVCLRNEREGVPSFMIAGGAHLDPEAAVRDALAEVTQVFVTVPSLASGRDDGRPDLERREWRLSRSAASYAFPEHFDEVSFLFEGDPRPITSYPDPDVAGVRDELERCVDALERAGCTPIAVDVTTDPIREMGARVARVVVPQLLDLKPQYAVQANHPVFDGETVTSKPHPFP